MSVKLFILINIFIFPVISAIITGCDSNTKENDDTKKEIYYVYYFHPTARCESCLNLEAFIKELIETKFSEKGIIFKSLNIEHKENEHFRKDYNLMFSSVIVSKIKNKTEEKWKNLDSIWSFTMNKTEFFRYTDKEIQNFIKEK